MCVCVVHFSPHKIVGEYALTINSPQLLLAVASARPA